MGYSNYGYGQALWNAIHLDDSALDLNDGLTKPLTMMVGGVFNNASPSYTDGDAAVMQFTSSGKLKVDASINIDSTEVVVQTATGAVAINTTTSISAEFKLLKVCVHFSAAPTTSEDLTVTLDSNAGAAYDTVLGSVDPSSSSLTDWVFVPADGSGKFVDGDEIVVAFTNTDTETYGLSIYYELI